jgi:hypothetical protein
MKTWSRKSLIVVSVVLLVGLNLMQGEKKINNLDLGALSNFVTKAAPSSLSSSSSANAKPIPGDPKGDDISNEPATNGDWFDADEWNSSSYTDSCMVLDDICHASTRFFFRPGSPHHESRNKSHVNVLLQGPFDGPMGRGRGGYPKDIPIEHASNLANLSCRDANVPNHLILTGFYIDMLGEFYVRVLKGWYEIFHNVIDTNATRRDAFLQQTQLYLLFQDADKHMMDSHMLFTAPFRGQHALMDFRDLLHPTDCRCMKRLIFCGFRQEEKKEEQLVVVSPSHAVASPPNSKRNYQGLRHELRQRIILDNPLVQEKIKIHRSEILREHNVDEKEWGNWTVVGLSNRKGRRRWTNVETIQNECNGHLRGERVVCVAVYVDDEHANPFRQVILHGALDVLLGIHGSQLTEAIWMRPGALVVELLAYIPAGVSWGQWTRTTKNPTPIGVSYHGTDLNHIGYVMKQKSAIDCKYFTNLTEVDKCFETKNWASRDFTADADEVMEPIRRFHLSRELSSCEYWKNQSESTDGKFAFYNVNCAESSGEKLSPHYFGMRGEPSDWNFFI